MSTRVVGYEGRRAIRIDEGPASAGYVDQVGPGKASLLAGIPDRALASGAGDVERRFVSQAEVAARAEVRPSAIPPVPKRPKGRASHKPGHPWVMPKPAPSPAPEEEPVEPAQDPAHDMTTPEDEEPRTGLAALADALVEAMEAEGELEQATALLDQAGVRWQQARAALDAAYRALDEPAAATRPEAEPVVESGADHAETIPVAAHPVAPAAEQGAMPAYQRRILDALLATGGDRAGAAAKLGYKPTSLTGTLGRIRKRTDLTEAERSVLGGQKAAS